MVHDTFCACGSPGSVNVLAALAARSLDDVVTRGCVVKIAGGTAATAATAGPTGADARGCAAEAATAAATAAGSTIVVAASVIKSTLAGTAGTAAQTCCCAARGCQMDEGRGHTECAHGTGGCTGAVWGTLFMRCGMKLMGKTEFTLAEGADALESAIEGISKRGGAVLGDKTVLDAFDVIVKSLRASVEADDDLHTALSKAAEAAVECKETTKGWVAKRGRQFFTGDRSIGTYDPGIVAVGIIATNIAEALK